MAAQLIQSIDLLTFMVYAGSANPDHQLAWMPVGG